MTEIKSVTFIPKKPKVKTVANRETYLASATDYLRPWFAKAGYEIPADVRVTCGFPSRNATRGANGKRAIGMCWSRTCSEAGINEIAISPYLSGEDDTQEVLGTLVHELVHAVDDCVHEHGAVFRQIATAVGLTGKMTSTESTPQLIDHLQVFIDKQGPFPHASLDVKKTHKKQSTRMVKAACVNNDTCEPDARGNLYTVRLSRSWIEQGGAPVCPICTHSMVADA